MRMLPGGHGVSSLSFRAAAALALLVQAGAAAAQDVSDAGVAPIVQRGERCPSGAANELEEEILVCGTRSRDSVRYRLPIEGDGFDPTGPVDSVSRERHRLYEVGASGIGSCSTTGPGGYTGCDLIRWKDAKEQHAKRKQGDQIAIGVGPFQYRIDDD